MSVGACLLFVLLSLSGGLDFRQEGMLLYERPYYLGSLNNNDFISIALFHVKHAQLH